MSQPPAIKSFSKAASMAEFYERAPLDSLPPDTIRLLDLKPGTGYEDIKCSIARARLADQPKYYGLCPPGAATLKRSSG
jgi:hypothetical protein